MKTAWRALHFLREMDHGLPEEERENVALAFREILFNAVEHGGGNNPNVYVTVTYTRGDRAHCCSAYAIPVPVSLSKSCATPQSRTPPIPLCSTR